MKTRMMIACLLLGMLSLGGKVLAQSPTSGAAVAANRGEAVPVNYYTGIPSISIPLYSYSHRNGIGMNVSLDYFAGGIKVNEVPSSAGLGWNLSAGGVITRTIRGGVADDDPVTGYMNTRVPFDVRPNKSNYFTSCVDPEQDVFQFNFMGYSGKFFIGNDTSVFITPLSKIRIKFNRTPYNDAPPNPNTNGLDSVYASIQNFTVTTEDGVKYYFNEREEQSMVSARCGSANVRLIYSSAWYLSKIVSALGSDSIKISYASRSSGNFNMVQSVKIDGSTVTHSDTSSYFNMHFTPDVNTINAKVPQEITLPDSKKVSFYYSNRGQFRYSSYPLLQRVKIMDSTLIYGYILNWDTTGMGSNTRDFLSGINYFTETAVKPGYKFTYNAPYFGLPKLVCHTVFNSNGMPDHEVCETDTTDNSPNMKDHWGYYNGANNNREYVPAVPGLYNGANREPNSLAVAGSLKSVQDPAGGITYYDFENNTVYPYTNTRQSIAFNAAAGSQSSMAVGRVWGGKSYFRVSLLASNSYGFPISGAGQMNISVTNTAGTVTYATKVLSLSELYYTGYLNFSLALAPGTYLFSCSPASGTSSSAALPCELSWYNQAAQSGSGNLTGGIRIRQIRHYDPFTAKTDTLSTYRYVLEDGKSSGFLGATPVYNYTVYGGTTYIKSEAVNDFDYSQGNPVGYSRVEVINGSSARNLGKKVFEFTNANDAEFDCSIIEYPFVQRVQRDFALGLPKRTLTYDNTGRLVQSQTNSYSYIIKAPQPDSNFRSFKLIPKSSGNAVSFNGAFYYPEAGRADLIASADTFFHPDNSVTVSRKTIEYDTNYNAVKITTPYDLNRSLNLEKRMYYPYNYTLGGAIGTLRDSSIFVPVSSETWITGDGNPRLLAAGATAFAGTNVLTGGGLIRPTMSYSLQSNAPVPQSVIGAFDPSVLVRNTNYIVPQQSFVYDKKGFLLQATSLPSGITGFSIYGYNNTRTIAAVSNAKPADAAYSSFEPASDGSWGITSSARDSSSAITGRFSYDLSNGQISKGGLTSSVTYLITYWTKGTVSVPGASSAAALDQRNGWTLKSQKIAGVTDISVSGSGLIDELRLYPVDANMATTTYEHSGEVSSSCDAGNNITYYEYDNANRLRVVRNKDRNVVKKIEYSDVVTTVSIVPNWQTIIIPNAADLYTCERDTLYQFNGRVDRSEKDTNPYSETYLSYRFVFDHIDSTRCPPPPPANPCGTAPDLKYLNNTCEHGCRVNTSTVRQKVIENGVQVLRWVCTYHYHWSDNSSSPDYTESNTSACSLGNSCGLD